MEVSVNCSKLNNEELFNLDWDMDLTLASNNNSTNPELMANNGRGHNTGSFNSYCYSFCC